MPARLVALVVAWVGVATAASAQSLPSAPITFGDGRVVLGGEAAVSVGEDDPGFFNYSDYEHSALRELRLGLSARVRVTDRIAVLADVRTENFDRLALFALYARVRPLLGRRLDVQIGRIPPVFGSFSRQSYGHQTPLIGSLLAYQYLTSLRADAAPAHADELLGMRGRGWLSAFTVGNTAPARGVPLVTAAHWNTGIQLSTGWRILGVAAAVTNGTPSRPRIDNDERVPHVSARVTITPLTGLTIGTSAARGPFLNRAVLDLVGEDGTRRRAGQRAYGADAEYSRGHGVLRAELVLSRWIVPMPAVPSPAGALRALGASIEGKYTLRPGLYMAARGEHLTFNRISGTTQTARWDAPVTRLEFGGGYHLQRNMVAKAALQLNWRDGGRVTRARLLAAQLRYWF